MDKKYKDLAFSWYKKAYSRKILTNKPITKKEFSSFMKATIFSLVSKDFQNQVDTIIYKTFNYARDRVKKKVAQVDKSNAIQTITIDIPELKLKQALKYAILNDLISCKNNDCLKMTEFLKIIINENNLQNKGINNEK